MSSMRILQIAHDHPDWTQGGTEILAHDLARALDARAGVAARFLAASTSLQEPDAPRARCARTGTTSCCRPAPTTASR